MTLKKQVIWAGVDTFLSQALAFIFRLILAYKLAPEQFGLLSMASATISIVQMINDFGLSASIIQKNQQNLTRDFIAMAFTASTIISVIVFIINQLILADLSAIYFRSRTVESLVRGLGLVFLLMPISSISIALLNRAKNFLTIAKCRAIAQIIGISFGLFYLYLFGTAWAFIVQVLTTQIIQTILLYWHAPWNVQFTYKGNFKEELLGFSGFVFLNNFLVSITKNIDQIILGRFVSSEVLGKYSLCFFITDYARASIMSIINRVLFVHYSENKYSNELILRNYFLALSMNCSVIYPIMVFIIFFGGEFLPLIIGAKWTGLDNVIQILALSVLVHVSGGSTSSILTAIGKPKLDFYLFASTSIFVTLPFVSILSYKFGSLGAASAVLISKLISIPIRQVVLSKILGMSLLAYTKLIAMKFLEVMPLAIAFYAIKQLNMTRHPYLFGVSIFIISLPYIWLFLIKLFKKSS